MGNRTNEINGTIDQRGRSTGRSVRPAQGQENPDPLHREVQPVNSNRRSSSSKNPSAKTELRSDRSTTASQSDQESNRSQKESVQSAMNADTSINDEDQVETSKRVLKLVTDSRFSMTQINGQRKLGGPPPGWTGPAPGPGCEVFVGKIPRTLYEHEIYPIFRTMGEVYEIRLMMDFSGTNRGYCFVMFGKPEYAQRAIKELDNFEIRPGRRIGVVASINNCRLYVGQLPPDLSSSTVIKKICDITDDVSRVAVYRNTSDQARYALISYKTHRGAAMARRRLVPDRATLFEGAEVSVDWAHPSMFPSNVVEESGVCGDDGKIEITKTIVGNENRRPTNRRRVRDDFLDHSIRTYLQEDRLADTHNRNRALSPYQQKSVDHSHSPIGKNYYHLGPIGHHMGQAGIKCTRVDPNQLAIGQNQVFIAEGHVHGQGFPCKPSFAQVVGNSPKTIRDCHTPFDESGIQGSCEQMQRSLLGQAHNVVIPSPGSRGIVRSSLENFSHFGSSPLLFVSDGSSQSLGQLDLPMNNQHQRAVRWPSIQEVGNDVGMLSGVNAKTDGIILGNDLINSEENAAHSDQGRLCRSQENGAFESGDLIMLEDTGLDVHHLPQDSLNLFDNYTFTCGRHVGSGQPNFLDDATLNQGCQGLSRSVSAERLMSNFPRSYESRSDGDIRKPRTTIEEDKCANFAEYGKWNSMESFVPRVCISSSQERKSGRGTKMDARYRNEGRENAVLPPPGFSTVKKDSMTDNKDAEPVNEISEKKNRSTQKSINNYGGDNVEFIQVSSVESPLIGNSCQKVLLEALLKSGGDQVIRNAHSDSDSGHSSAPSVSNGYSGHSRNLSPSVSIYQSLAAMNGIGGSVGSLGSSGSMISDQYGNHYVGNMLASPSAGTWMNDLSGNRAVSYSNLTTRNPLAAGIPLTSFPQNTGITCLRQGSSHVNCQDNVYNSRLQGNMDSCVPVSQANIHLLNENQSSHHDAPGPTGSQANTNVVSVPGSQMNLHLCRQDVCCQNEGSNPNFRSGPGTHIVNYPQPAIGSARSSGRGNMRAAVCRQNSRNVSCYLGPVHRPDYENSPNARQNTREHINPVQPVVSNSNSPNICKAIPSMDLSSNANRAWLTGQLPLNVNDPQKAGVPMQNPLTSPIMFGEGVSYPLFQTPATQSSLRTSAPVFIPRDQPVMVNDGQNLVNVSQNGLIRIMPDYKNQAYSSAGSIPRGARPILSRTYASVCEKN